MVFLFISLNSCSGQLNAQNFNRKCREVGFFSIFVTTTNGLLVGTKKTPSRAAVVIVPHMCMQHNTTHVTCQCTQQQHVREGVPTTCPAQDRATPAPALSKKARSVGGGDRRWQAAL